MNLKQKTEMGEFSGFDNKTMDIVELNYRIQLCDTLSDNDTSFIWKIHEQSTFDKEKFNALVNCVVHKLAEIQSNGNAIDPKITFEILPKLFWIQSYFSLMLMSHLDKNNLCEISFPRCKN